MAKTDKNYFIDSSAKRGIDYMYGISATRSLPDKFQKVIDYNKADPDVGEMTFDLKEDYKQAAAE